MNKILALVLFCLGIAAQAAPSNLVLVPGFFSSAIPAPENFGNPWKQPYFSHDIVRHLAARTAHLWVVDTLNPVGSVEENGKRLITFLRNRQKDFGGQPITLLAHSAGGLYSLFAAANSDLPINHIIAVSTPFRGLRVIQALEDQGIPFDELAAPFCLKNLSGLKEAPVRKFITGLQLKHPVRLDVFAGYQTTGVAFWDWRILSPPLVPFQALIREPSDGIVSVQSSLNVNDLKFKNPANLDVHVHSQTLPLEHWELIIDAELTRLYGIQNIRSLRQAQLHTYSLILEQAE